MLRLLLAILLALVLGIAGILVAGSLRYGGMEGLAFRLRTEIAERRPIDHPLTVPTPLPVAGCTLNVEGCAATPVATKGVAGCTVNVDVCAVAPDAVPAGVALAKATAAPTTRPTATFTPDATPSHTPTPKTNATATATSTATTVTTAAAVVTAVPLVTAAKAVVAPAVTLTGLTHAWQTWNNCGPATLAMQLSYFGSTLTQEQVRQALRPNRDDKNVNLAELAEFARGQGLHAAVLVNGDPDHLRLLLSNGLPVFVETWLEPKPNDGMGHYRLLTGYDQARSEWVAYDSYIATGGSRDGPYQPLRLPYAEMATLWRVFNRAYLVLYTDAQAPVVAAVLGPNGDGAAGGELAMWQAALAQAETEIDQNPQDAFAWFNRGSALVALGRYEDAAAAYDQARVIGLPWRMLWYQFGPFQAYYEVGRYQEVVALAEATLRTTESIEELHYWRGRGLQALGQTEAAAAAYRRAVAFNPGYRPAAEALAALTGS